MLGHPGFSAFEYAGEAERRSQESKVHDKIIEQNLYLRATRHDSVPSAELTREEHDGDKTAMYAARVASPSPSECAQPPTPPADDFTLAQRRRGTFINHTPRGHEVRLSRTVSPLSPTVSEDLDRVYAAYRGSSDEYTETSTWSNSRQHSSFGSFTAPQSPVSRGNAVMSLPFDGKEVPMNPLMMNPLSPTSILFLKHHRSQNSSGAASIKSSETALSKQSVKHFFSRNASLDAPIRHVTSSGDESEMNEAAHKPLLRAQTTANSKRRRRQTPFNIPTMTVAELGKHAPLEPLVARHRREVTGSNVDPLPPVVDIDNDISAAATLLAINEYFEGQEAPAKDTSVELSKQDLPPPVPEKSPEQKRSYSSSTRTSSKADTLSLSDSLKQPTPNLPERNPDRLSKTSAPNHLRRSRSASELSAQSDFTSAAKGQYSPYDPRFDTASKPLPLPPTPASPPPVEPDRSCSAASGRLAPRIAGHDELANSRLNDFNYFLRMTGPPSPSSANPPPKKKRGLKAIKVRGAPGAREMHPPSSPPPPLPACAREMTTKSGTKHLQIVIPAASVSAAPGGTVSLPVVDGTGRARRVSIAWTEEMLQPLGSAAVERAIHPPGAGSQYDSGEDGKAFTPLSPLLSAPCTPAALRSPVSKPEPITPRSVTVDNDHPLLVTRKEATRNRKLRDLQKVRGREWEREAEERVRRLEVLVEELRGALVRCARIEGGEGLGAEEVLGVWRERVGEL